MRIKNKNRIWELDFLRGIALLLMVYFHLIYDMKEFFGYAVNYESTFNAAAGRIAAILFILVSGVSCSLSRSNIIRGFKLLMLALAVSAASYFYNPDFVIKFGILHFLAAGMILYPLLEKLNPLMLALSGTAIIILGRYTAGITVTNEYLFPLGLTTNNFISSDYYSLIPWLGLFIYGIFLSKLFYKEKRSLLGFEFIDNIISMSGRHTLLIYLLHQPVIVAVLWSIEKLSGRV